MGRILSFAVAGLLLAGVHSTAEAQTLTGFASLPADTFAPGPTSGQFIAPANGRIPPFVESSAGAGILVGTASGQRRLPGDVRQRLRREDQLTRLRPARVSARARLQDREWRHRDHCGDSRSSRCAIRIAGSISASSPIGTTIRAASFRVDPAIQAAAC